MSDGASLINLGDLSKPATVLIEKISDAVGIIYEPHRIRRRAHAEVDAKAIHAVGDIKIQEVSKRAIMRLIQEETRKQENIENITAKAIPQLSESANPQNVENDWLLNFFDKCKVISNEDMQKIWARILAEEANKPNSFSKRTIDTLAMMSKSDAETFMCLCKFVWHIGNNCPIILDVDNTIYKENGINFNTLTYLNEIGLVTFNNITGFNRIQLPKRVIVWYFGSKFILEFPKDSENHLLLGNAMFSRVGEELFAICEAQEESTFPDYVKANWISSGVVVTPIVEKQYLKK